MIRSLLAAGLLLFTITAFAQRKPNIIIAAAHPALMPVLDAIVKKEHRPAHIREWEFLDSKVTVKEKM